MGKEKEHTLKEAFIKLGVAKLKNFGFVNVNKSNILTDEVYALYFSKILHESLGDNLEKDVAIKELIGAMDALIK